MTQLRVAIVDVQCVVKDKKWIIKEFSIKPVYPQPNKIISLMFSHNEQDFNNESNRFSLAYIGTDYTTGDLPYNPNVIFNYVNDFDILLVKGKNKMQALENCFIHFYIHNTKLSHRWLDVWFKPLNQSYINVYNIDDEPAYRSPQSFLYSFKKPNFSLVNNSYGYQPLQRSCQYNHDGACAFRNVWKIYRNWWQKSESYKL